MQDELQRKIGIWGYGIVGKSLINFFQPRVATLSVLEKRLFTEEEKSFFKQHGIQFFSEDQKHQFLEENDFIIASPGIDLRPYHHFLNKFITELDIFSSTFEKPIIAITGTVGKTSTTHFLSTVLAQSMRVRTGGNIGTAMLDIASLQNEIDYAVLELSSFQLEYCARFAPQLAIWTNFYPNHLDRHGTIEAYLEAKMHILVHQHENQSVLLPIELLSMAKMRNYLMHAQQKISFFSVKPISEAVVVDIPWNTLFWIEGENIKKRTRDGISNIYEVNALPQYSYAVNWLIVISALSLLDIPHANLSSLNFDAPVLDHRLERIATKEGIIFYDDSKSTLTESTLAAINTFKKEHIILMLGGLSKGVDRSKLIRELPANVRAVICFGKEAEQLEQWCSERNLQAYAAATLEDAFSACNKYANPETPVLFSPSGSSYDLFSDYKMRGMRFKELIAQHYTIL